MHGVTKLTLLLLFLFLLACEESTVASPNNTPAPPRDCAAGMEGPYRVAHVSDADTIVVRVLDIKPVTVRLIGVDSPEVDGPYRRGEPGGVEAQKFVRSLLASESVYLETDPAQGRRDKHGRMLAYVHRASDCMFVNGEIIRRGHGESYRRFRFRHRELFDRYEREARMNRRGIWQK